MRRLALACALSLTACAHGVSLFRSRSTVQAEARADSIYWAAVRQLDAANTRAALDSAIASLDAYLAYQVRLEHREEAQVLRRLTHDAQQLARVEGALQEARASAADSTARRTERGESQSRSRDRDEEMVKEIQRLKDELAKANAELDRIKKRLAAPPTKP
jgi:vacuolar-type H+-ATPase subunit I/STV1